MTLLLFSNGVISEGIWKLIEYPLKRLDYSLITPSDGIVVLSGARHLPPGDSKIIEWTDPDRFLSGINLFLRGKSNKLIFTGGINPLNRNLPPEGDIYIKEAISMGITRESLYTTSPVNNTYQEAKAIRKLLNKEINRTQQKIILVTSAFHMQRAKKVFEKQGFIVQPYPVDFQSSNRYRSTLNNPIEWVPSSYNLNKSSRALREIIGRIVYRSWK